MASHDVSKYYCLAFLKNCLEIEENLKDVNELRVAKDKEDLVFFINVYHKLTFDILVGGMAEQLEHWNCDPQTMSSISTVTADWICSW